MIKLLRNKKIAKILFAGLLAAFILWGAGSVMLGRTESAYAGTMFGKKVSTAEFKDAIQATRIQFFMRFGENFYRMQQYLNIESQAWQRLMLIHEAKQRKIKVNDQEVVNHIASLIDLTRKGKFDTSLYSATIQQRFGIQPRVFEEYMRQGLMISRLFEETTRAVSVTDDDVRLAYRRENELVSVNYLAALYADYSKDITPDEKALKEYFQANAAQFKRPLSFNVEYVTAETENAIRAFLKRTRNHDPTAVSKELNLTLRQTGLFPQTGPIPEIGWSPQILGILSRLKVGEWSGPIYTDKFYVLRLKERKDPAIPDFSEISDLVKQAYITHEAQRMAREKIEQCRAKIQAATGRIDAAALAREFTLKSASTELFKFAGYLEGIGSSDQFWAVADTAKTDAWSDVIAMPSGLYLVSLKEHKPFDTEKFTQEKETFTENLLQQRKEEFFQEFLKNLEKKAGLS